MGTAARAFNREAYLKAPSKRARVLRVVAGKLVYVDAGGETFAFKPDSIVIRHKDGSFSPYRGEPFSEIGLHPGSTVMVFRLSDFDPGEVLLVEEGAGLSLKWAETFWQSGKARVP